MAIGTNQGETQVSARDVHPGVSVTLPCFAQVWDPSECKLIRTMTGHEARGDRRASSPLTSLISTGQPHMH